MDETLRKEIFERLDQIAGAVADKTGAAAEYFWPLAVRQEFISGASHIFYSVFAAVLLFVAWRLWMRAFRFCLAESKRSHSDDCWPIAIVPGVFVAFGTCFALFLIPHYFVSGLSLCLNPEYAALRTMISLITGRQG